MWVGPGVGGTRGGALTIKKAPFYCESPTPGPAHTGSHPHVVSSTHRSIMASPLPFSFASMRAQTQDHRDIIEMGSTLTTN